MMNISKPIPKRDRSLWSIISYRRTRRAPSYTTRLRSGTSTVRHARSHESRPFGGESGMITDTTTQGGWLDDFEHRTRHLPHAGRIIFKVPQQGPPGSCLPTNLLGRLYAGSGQTTGPSTSRCRHRPTRSRRREETAAFAAARGSRRTRRMYRDPRWTFD